MKVNYIHWEKGFSQNTGKLCPVLMVQQLVVRSGRDTPAHLQIPSGFKDAV